MTFKWDTEAFVNEVQECVGRIFIFSGNGEVVYLAHEYDAGSVDVARVKARFVDCRGESQVAKYRVSMLFP